jgi:L-lactate dehydrogenase (cytochrome)
MRDVSVVDTSTSMLNLRSRYPFFIAPMGLVGTVHEDGELALARAGARMGVHYCISTATTKSHEDIIRTFEAERQTQTSTGEKIQGEVFFQLYVHSQRQITQDLLRKIRALGYRGLFITADTPVVGKRIADRKLQAKEAIEAGLKDEGVTSTSTQNRVEGGRAPPGVLSSSLNWNDLAWIRKEWEGPIVIKGVQCATDVKIASNLGVQGVYLSNHGGRQLQDAPSSLDTLLETRNLYPEVFGKVEVFVDGGFSNGADILKAICLGATAVGIGRPFMYAVAGYGTKGAMRVIDSELQL